MPEAAVRNGATIAASAETGQMHTARNSLRELLLDLRSILWPCSCTVCATPDRELCAPCEAALRATIGRQRRVAAPLRTEVWAYGPYEGAVRRLIVKYKHGGAIRFAPLLGALLTGPLAAALGCGSGPTLIVAAPSRIERVQSRGYRHLDLLVKHSLRQLARRGDSRGQRARFLPGALQAIPGRSGQLGLSAAERISNARLIRVPRRMHSRLQGSEVVLVDDVMTTGATLNAAIQALAAVGARVVAVAIVNNTQRKDEIISDGLLNYVETEGSTAVGFEKGVKVRPPMWPPA